MGGADSQPLDGNECADTHDILCEVMQYRVNKNGPGSPVSAPINGAKLKSKGRLRYGDMLAAEPQAVYHLIG
jgi:hypothetical protein